jgi:hypothetical protein
MDGLITVTGLGLIVIKYLPISFILLDLARHEVLILPGYLASLSG